MTHRERIISLVKSSGYTVAVCLQETDRMTLLFYRADHIYQLECYYGEWDCTVLWGAAHDDSWDFSRIGKSEGIFVPLTMCFLDSVSDADLQNHLSEAITKCDAAQIKDNFIRANTSEVLVALQRDGLSLIP